MTCDDFQIAVERRLHGDLGEAEEALLERHLSSCEACGAYAARAREVEASMAKSASEALANVDWNRAERGIREGMAAATRGVVASVIGGVFMVVLAWATRGPALTDARLLRMAAAMAVTMGVIAVMGGLAARKLSRLERGAEMLAEWRRGVRLRVRFARWLHWPNLALAGWFGWKAVRGDTTDGKVEGAIFYGVLAALLLAVALYNRLVKLPRALREEAELGPEPRA